MPVHVLRCRSMYFSHPHSPSLSPHDLIVLPKLLAPRVRSKRNRTTCLHTIPGNRTPLIRGGHPVEYLDTRGGADARRTPVRGSGGVWGSLDEFPNSSSPDGAMKLPSSTAPNPVTICTGNPHPNFLFPAAIFRSSSHDGTCLPWFYRIQQGRDAKSSHLRTQGTYSCICLLR